MNKPISVDDHVLRCAICSHVHRIEEHHVINRSQGGEDGPTIYVCSDCHRMFTEDRWFLRWDSKGFTVGEVWTGALVMRRRIDPNFDQSLYLHNLERMRGLIDNAYLDVPKLDDEGLLDAAATSRAWGKSAQIYQVALVLEAHLRTPYGQKVELLKDLAGLWDVSLTTIQNRLKIGQTWEIQRLLKLPDLPVKPLLLAAASNDPNANIDRIEELQTQGMGSENIYRTLKGETLVDWRPCPCCSKPGDPKTFKWKGE